jgi:hypothetical protein
MRFKPAVVVLLAFCGILSWAGSAWGSVTNTRILSGPSGTIFTDEATFEFSSPLDGGFQCRLDSQDWRDWEWCASPQTYSSLADGAHRFEVRALNRPGNPDPTPSARSFEVATEPPDTTITAAPTGTIAVDSAAFAFESTQPGSFECRLDSSAEADWEACASPQPYSELGQGSHSFEVRAVNAGGHADPTPATASFAVDTEAPQTSLVGPPLGTVTVDSASFAFEATEDGGFECRLDSADEADWEPCSSPVSYTGLGPGTHVFEVRAVDAIGNVDATPAVDTFSFQPPQPIVALATIAPGHPKPVAGESVNLELVSGVVELRCPGEEEASRLVDFKQVPLGCLINTRRGVVDLAASKGSSGEVQDAHFWGGVFITDQEAGDDEIVDLELAGRRMCERRGDQPPPGPASGQRRGRPLTVRARGKGGGRKLWGSGKGNYKTSGSYGSATVRGTTWLVVDRCDASTLIRVGEGTVWARDFVQDKTVVLTTGEQYLAKAQIPRLNLENLR